MKEFEVKSKRKFKKGDRVIISHPVNRSIFDNACKGMIGTVLKSEFDLTEVKFDEKITDRYAYLPENCIKKNKYKVYTESLELYECNSEREVRYSTKENKVIATLYVNGKYVKHAIARCNPIDEFDYEIGKNIATKRLDDPNYMLKEMNTFSMLCIKDCENLCKKGKVYTVKNGIIDFIGNEYRYEDFEDFKLSEPFASKYFVELQESDNKKRDCYLLCTKEKNKGTEIEINVGEVCELKNGNLFYPNGYSSGAKYDDFNDFIKKNTRWENHVVAIPEEAVKYFIKEEKLYTQSELDEAVEKAVKEVTGAIISNANNLAMEYKK